ncbi:putative membrane protein YphA (DoxX/SURF4 family) [Paenibacillus rhizosphaerae]|uniref:Putative membrane protein YphA (DoxX/SURF4 family) n=1 Tax=Paenibacillus rhizosphaerae TaxID=297318 RepID=A0A839TZM5_9BACL|nr:DoxX family protein [Paenibacillus rhizosphaerae]MBB3131921.1 putative membrane protein YphA (DoxX/SURF4 family) [Paenibacillus rhizosphaerae]
MNIVLWILQGILGAGFIYSGWMKAFQQEKARTAWPWVGDVPKPLASGIGMLEWAGVLGVILPLATGIAPVLTPIAALGLAVTVLLGAAFHVFRKEYKEIGINIAFLVLAIIVVVGRW